MRLHLETTSAAVRITGYGPGYVEINEQRYASSLLLMPEGVRTDWRPASIEELTRSDFTPVLEAEPEIILLGTGSRQIFPSASVLPEVQIGFEIMDTTAACRTFNVLAAENRVVVAALFMPQRR